MRIVRAGLAAMLAGALAVILFLFLGVALPMWTMAALYGRQAVQDAPAHGGMILFLTLPIAGIISLPAFLILAVRFYQKFKPNDA